MILEDDDSSDEDTPDDGVIVGKLELDKSELGKALVGSL